MINVTGKKLNKKIRISTANSRLSVRSCGWELALHNRDFLEVTASILWHPAKPAPRARTGIVATCSTTTVLASQRSPFCFRLKNDDGFTLARENQRVLLDRRQR